MDTPTITPRTSKRNTAQQIAYLKRKQDAIARQIDARHFAHNDISTALAKLGCFERRLLSIGGAITTSGGAEYWYEWFRLHIGDDQRIWDEIEANETKSEIAQ